jgi:hypothetical protein
VNKFSLFWQRLAASFVRESESDPILHSLLLLAACGPWKTPVLGISGERRTTLNGPSLGAETSRGAGNFRKLRETSNCSQSRDEDGAFVPDGERGSGSHAIAYLVALSPLRRFLNPSQPGWPTSSEEGRRWAWICASGWELPKRSPPCPILCRLVYRMLQYGQDYVDKGMEFYQQRCQKQQIDWMPEKAKHLGLVITLTADPAAK